LRLAVEAAWNFAQRRKGAKKPHPAAKPRGHPKQRLRLKRPNTGCAKPLRALCAFARTPSTAGFGEEVKDLRINRRAAWLGVS
jgi:hypothetical protein